MAYIKINGADIYYQVYGDENPHRTPIVLVHGSTVDSHTDWDSVIPALAKEYRVYAPDCRGHGRSNNPNKTYSFKELAHDLATFVHAMGYKRAHIIGHSNGGNVALVTLMEYLDIVQTCVMQAANAFVTEYLIEREPVVFDPDRVAREDPDWMNEMIHLHGAVNGEDYWRGLLALTMKEIICQPDYSPAELACASDRRWSSWARTTGSTRLTGTRNTSPNISPLQSYGFPKILVTTSTKNGRGNGWKKYWIF